MIGHLMLTCPFTKQTWQEVLSWLRLPAPAPEHDGSLMDWWLRAKEFTPPALRKALKSVALLVPWMIWKHRNACVFDHVNPSLNELVDRIKARPDVGQRLELKLAGMTSSDEEA